MEATEFISKDFIIDFGQVIIASPITATSIQKIAEGNFIIEVINHPGYSAANYINSLLVGACLADVMKSLQLNTSLTVVISEIGLTLLVLTAYIDNFLILTTKNILLDASSFRSFILMLDFCIVISCNKGMIYF